MHDSAARANPSGTFAVAAVLAVLAGVSGLVGAAIQARQQAAPAARVLVVDVTRLVEPIAADPGLTDAERVTQARALSEAIGRAVAERVAAGAIVLEADAVYAAPPDAYVRP